MKASTIAGPHVHHLDEDDWRGWKQDDFPQDCWERAGGVLRARAGAARVSLVSRRRFADFDLSLQWRLPPGGNSGVFYRVDERVEAPWQSGPEMQLLDDTGHPDARVPETRCGALYGIVAPIAAAPSLPGIVHVARIVVRGTRVEHWLDGLRVVACDLADPQLRARAASGKFGAYEDFARSPDGHIVLQHHGSAVEFLDIRVETG